MLVIASPAQPGVAIHLDCFVARQTRPPRNDGLFFMQFPNTLIASG
jgi:hypothetical protein